jgi:hypothetical protein
MENEIEHCNECGATAGYVSGRKYETAREIIRDLRAELAALRAQEPMMSAREVITNTIGFEFLPGELQTVNSDDLVAVVHAARLYAAPVVSAEQQGVAHGYLVVPRELANIAALHLENSCYTETGKRFRALLAAAPAPSTTEGKS